MTNDLVNAVRASIVEVGLSKTLEQVAQVVEDEGMEHILKISSALKTAALKNGEELPARHSSSRAEKSASELMARVQTAKSAQQIGAIRRALRKKRGIPVNVVNEINAASEARLTVLRLKA